MTQRLSQEQAGACLGSTASHTSSRTQGYGLEPFKRAPPLRHRVQPEEGIGFGSGLTASARSMATVTFSRTCSATVLVHVNWNTIAASKMCLVATTQYSVSSSVSCTCAGQQGGGAITGSVGGGSRGCGRGGGDIGSADGSRGLRSSALISAGMTAFAANTAAVVLLLLLP